MPSECGTCTGDGVLWCSIRDELDDTNVTPACMRPSLADQIAEAKAEIERLRKEYDIAQDEHEMYKKGARARAHSRRQECQDWRIQCEEADRELAVYTASVKADREIGRLVRGMTFGTELRRTYASLDGTPVWMAMQLVKGCWEFVAMSCKDPAEALRAIQKEIDE